MLPTYFIYIVILYGFIISSNLFSILVTEILLSQGKPARQKTHTSNNHYASLAVDGNTNQQYPGGSCTHTLLDYENWIRIDLENRAVVNSVTIYNRADCCSERLTDASIDLASDADNIVNKQICTEFYQIKTANQIENFKCNPSTNGIFVRLTIHSYNILTVCEMQVWGYFM